MDNAQLYTMLIGAGAVITSLAGIIYKLLLNRIAALETENKTLRDEARKTTDAKDEEIMAWRKMAMERSSRQEP